MTETEQEYLLLQKEYRTLQSKMTALQQAYESLKLRQASNTSLNEDISEELSRIQKDLKSQQNEYQSLQADYASLKATITPISSRLAASVAAHRRELIGTDLGTVVLKNERQLYQAVVTEITDDKLRIKFKDGWTWVSSTNLPTEIQQRFFYDPFLVPPSALLTESPVTEETPPAASPAGLAQALVEAAFAEAHRKELARLQISLQNKIPLLEKKIVAAQQQVKNLKKDRLKTAQLYNRGSSRIKRSSADRNKAFERIDKDIRKLEIAIQTAKIQIKGWQKELLKNKITDK
ncbi:MAG: hypothetical protein GXP30_06095 [Verrucomicrobia bacterium]|nr:hypothetical protein [Verrucomicrobiota bacterium]